MLQKLREIHTNIAIMISSGFTRRSLWFLLILSIRFHPFVCVSTGLWFFDDLTMGHFFAPSDRLPTVRVASNLGSLKLRAQLLMRLVILTLQRELLYRVHAYPMLIEVLICCY